MTPTVDFEPAGKIAIGNRLGEGIVWDAQSEAFLWTDIEGRTLFRLSWPAMRLEQFPLPWRLGSFALTARPGEIVAAFEHGFARYEFETDRCEWVCRPPLPHGVRFNDGRVDRRGRFVAGTMVEDPGKAGGVAAGALYRLEASGHATTLIEGIGISNALCWSCDGSTMYHADSHTAQLNAYPYGQVLGKPRLVKQLVPPAVPDGATVDADDRLWVALWGGGRVVAFSPAGTELAALPLPASQPACVAFGGRELDILAVTSAHHGLDPRRRSQEPDAGDVFFFRTTARGLEECRHQLCR